MTTTYKLNAQNARAAGASPYIAEKGAYTGKFLRAEVITSDKGTEGVEFTFESDDGARADYLTLWTVGADSKELYGRKVLDAIMTVMKLRQMTAQPTPTKRREGNTETPMQFRELLASRIGLFLVQEEYRKNGGEIGTKMVIVAPFEPTTNRMAAEILDQQAEARLFDKVLATLRDRPLQAAKRTQQSVSRSPNTASGTGFDNMDDDIPF